jgi:hypothetical protein
VIARHERHFERVDPAFRKDAGELLELGLPAVFGQIARDDQVIEAFLSRALESAHGAADARFGIDGAKQGQVSEPNPLPERASLDVRLEQMKVGKMGNTHVTSRAEDLQT